MAQTIKRGGKGVRRAAAARTTQRKVQSARQQTGSMLDTVMHWLPFSEETLHRIVMTVILAVAVALVWTVAVMAGIPALASEQAALIASDAGFKVSHLEVRGVNRMNEQRIYERVLGQNDRAMTTLDLAALRDELNQLPWVKDARVSRKLPDTLVIDIVERSPHAVLRKPDRLVLIDDTGTELETVKPDKAKGMLVLSGLGVGQRVEDLTRLLDAAPALKPQVAEAEWVGNRRWNLTFKTKQVLALPEGDEKSAGALLSFARMDGVNRLLGGKVAAFDMRAPDRIYMRVPGHAEEVAAQKRAAEQAKSEAKRLAAAAKSDEG
ncbi:cell division protein FtsQ/DivIB [Novosphingobium taihuense]|uniref:Cell division protein FtsQ n=1 Tax=Novosphingobium taihuense TaxID=260085 RepID=A0A7W7EXE3_9SPHN|nr:FtsQ-type POTRA domain-containing protein [Novosphingobium taihuense]MBB4615245.1 cell division protein FtsQ [Novosphingobium taihuense]TWH84280.1 cell division protein FtsQ [Novosphingobium taihuense]